MIYLIGGTPRCGKTTVAKRLAKQLNISWIATDYLTASAFQFIPEHEQGNNFPLSKAYEEYGTNDGVYRQYSAQEIAGFYKSQAKTMWPAVKMFMRAAVRDGEDFVLEGYHFLPQLVAGLDEEIIKNIKVVFLYREDVADIETNLRKGSHPEDWAIQNTQNQSTFVKIAEMISTYGLEIKNEAEECNMPVFCMDGSFEINVKKAVDQILSESNA